MTLRRSASLMSPLSPFWQWHCPRQLGWEDHQKLLGELGYHLGLQVLGFHQQDGEGQDRMTATILDPHTGDKGEVMMPGWLLQRLLDDSPA